MSSSDQEGGLTAEERAFSSLSDIQAVIESAKARGGSEALKRYIRKRLPEAEDEEVSEAAEVAVEIIDSIPIFLARARLWWRWMHGKILTA